MASKTHIGSQLPLSKYVIPIDPANTVQLNHFDISAEDINGIRPLSGGVYTLGPTKGKYGGTIAIEESTNNLWNGKTTTGSNGGWSIVDNPYPMFGLDDVVIKCTPRSYMNYWSHLDTDQVTYPIGTVFTMSAWVYVEPNCDSMGPIMINGERVTVGSATYDMSKKGTWQYLNFTVTSVSNSTYPTWAWYFLLYANTGTGANTWTTGNVYYTNVQVEVKPFATSYCDSSRANGELAYDNPLPGASNFTISFWINVKDATKTQQILTLNDNVDVNSLCIDILTGNNLRFFTYNSDGSARVASTTDWALNQWMYMTVVRDDNYLRGYINGVEKCIVANSGTVNLNGKLQFGMRSFANKGTTNILIDELRIDKVAVSPKEIMAWYVCDAPFYPRGITRIAR